MARSEQNTPEDKIIDDALASLISRHAEGLEVKKVRGLLPPPYRVSAARVRKRIDALAKGGRVHQWTKEVVAPEPFAVAGRRAVFEVLASGPKTRAQIQSRLPPTMRFGRGNALKKVLHQALAERTLFEHPDPKNKKAPRYARTPAEAKEYLRRVQKALDAELKRLARSGIDREGLIAALAGRPASRPDPEAILRAVLEVRPDAYSHVLVSVGDLRAHLGWPKSEFDRAVLGLAREGRITLHHHDHPSGLSPSERDLLVRDDRGNFYVGLVLEEAA